mmetsp:Transcript_14936/g.30262  ORF Transcript_14936/g.30262 Transcript_14936/m.30262 type:complete len:323 (+) Transcript_14936:582-1550(+)
MLDKFPFVVAQAQVEHRRRMVLRFSGLREVPHDGFGVLLVLAEAPHDRQLGQRIGLAFLGRFFNSRLSEHTLARLQIVVRHSASEVNRTLVALDRLRKVFLDRQGAVLVDPPQAIQGRWVRAMAIIASGLLEQLQRPLRVEDASEPARVAAAQLVLAPGMALASTLLEVLERDVVFVHGRNDAIVSAVLREEAGEVRRLRGSALSAGFEAAEGLLSVDVEPVAFVVADGRLQKLAGWSCARAVAEGCLSLAYGLFQQQSKAFGLFFRGKVKLVVRVAVEKGDPDPTGPFSPHPLDVAEEEGFAKVPKLIQIEHLLSVEVEGD